MIRGRQPRIDNLMMMPYAEFINSLIMVTIMSTYATWPDHLTAWPHPCLHVSSLSTVCQETQDQFETMQVTLTSGLRLGPDPMIVGTVPDSRASF